MNQEHTAAITEKEPASPGLFTIEPGLSIWTWVVFGLLLVILRKFAWKPLMDSVRSREQTMVDAVENARKTKLELERISLEQERLLQEAREEARKLIEDGRRESELVARQIGARAKEEAEKAMAQAADQINQEKELALERIREQAVEMVIAVSSKLIAANLDDATQRRIVEKHLEEL